MKNWDSTLNAPSSRTFIATIHIIATMVSWKRSGKERKEQTQFSTKFVVKLNFMLGWDPIYYFPINYWIMVLFQQTMICENQLVKTVLENWRFKFLWESPTLKIV
jgi:hypothetical protein